MLKSRFAAYFLTAAICLDPALIRESFADGVMDGGGDASTEILCDLPAAQGEDALRVDFISSLPSTATALISKWSPNAEPSNPRMVVGQAKVKRAVYLQSVALFENSSFKLVCDLRKAEMIGGSSGTGFVRYPCDLFGTPSVDGSTAPRDLAPTTPARQIRCCTPGMRSTWALPHGQACGS